MPKVVLITGASSGIGRATARRFAGPDTRIALVARGREGLNAVRREVLEAGGDALALPADVSDPGGDALALPADVSDPGVNTPQFEHCRDKFDKRSQPVAPVYQPEVAADAICWAAHHRRREGYVGIPTVYTIWGNKLAPWLAERHLARTAVSGQLSDTDKAPDRHDNHFDAPPGDPGAHGPYDDRAHGRSIQLWATKRRSELLTGVLAATTAASIGFVRRVR